MTIEPMDYNQTKKLFEGGLDLQTAIDVAIDVQGLIGVGLITYGDAIQQYVYNHSSQRKTAKPKPETFIDMAREVL